MLRKIAKFITQPFAADIVTTESDVDRSESDTDSREPDIEISSTTKNFLEIGPSEEGVMREIENSKGNVVRVSFGSVLGDVVYVKPEHIDLNDLLRQLDKKPEGRKAMALVDYMLEGRSLLANTDPIAVRIHHAFHKSLSRHEDSIRFPLKVLGGLTVGRMVSFTGLLNKPIGMMFVHRLFELEEFQPEFAHALAALIKGNNGLEENITSEAKKILCSVRYPRLTSTLASLLEKTAKKQYADNVGEFLFKQRHIVHEELRKYSRGEKITHIVAQLIIILMRHRHSEWRDDLSLLKEKLAEVDVEWVIEYLKDENINTLPGMMVPIDNITSSVSAAMFEISSNKELRDKIRATLNRNQLFIDNDEERMRHIIDTDPYLFSIYLESIRLRSLSKKDKRFSGVMWRFTKDEVSIKVNDAEKPGDEKSQYDNVIPANMVIAILGHSESLESCLRQANKFDPDRYRHEETGELIKSKIDEVLRVFSTGPRKCPAHDISKYIIILTICEIVAKYDITIQERCESDLDKRNRNDTNVMLTPRVDKEMTLLNTEDADPLRELPMFSQENKQKEKGKEKEEEKEEESHRDFSFYGSVNAPCFMYQLPDSNSRMALAGDGDPVYQGPTPSSP